MNLKEYNQKVLAVVGTLVLGGVGLSLAGALILFCVEIVGDLFQKDIEDQSITLIENKEQDSTATQLVVTSDVSFENPRLIDTLNAIYLIPVTKVNLENPTAINKSEELAEVSSSYSKRVSRFHYTGQYNNIIVYNQLEKQKKQVFKQPTFITDFSNLITASKHLILIKGTQSDTNKDGVLNAKDFLKLFIYDLNTEKIYHFGGEDKTYLGEYVLNDGNDLFLRFGFDSNKDTEFDWVREPVKLRTLSIKEMNDQPFLTNKENLDLVKLIN